MANPLRRVFSLADGELCLAEQLAVAQVQLFRGGRPDFELAAAKAIGVAPSERVGEVVGDTTRAMTVAPGRWLVVAAGDAELGARLAAAGLRVVDLGASRRVLRLSGVGTAASLQKGCSLDLAPAAFPPGSCASTLVAHYACLLHRLSDATTFDLYVARSMARSAWEWLCETAATDSAAHVNMDD